MPPPVTPEQLLEKMKDPSEPDGIVELCKKIGLSSGTINYWARTKPGFKRQYTLAKKKMASKNKKPQKTVNLKNRHTGWEEEFLEAYVLCNGRFGYACDVVGVGNGTVKDRLNPERNTFDPKFVEAFKEAQASVNRSLVDVAYKRAIEDESDTMIKFLLSTTMPEQFGSTTTHKIEGKIEHSVVERKAQEFLAGIFGEEVEGEFEELTEGRNNEDSPTKKQKRLRADVRADEGLEATGCNGSAALPLQERPILPAEV
jgi:hypothetical protein